MPSMTSPSPSSTVTSKLPSTSSLQSRLSSIAFLLDSYRWLIDSFVVEFFVEDHWKKLPPKWRDALDSMEEPSLLATLIQYGEPFVLTPPTTTTTTTTTTRTRTKTRDPFPLSLLAFRSACHALSLPRGSCHDNDVDALLFLEGAVIRESQQPQQGRRDLRYFTSDDKVIQYKEEMDHLLRRHVKPKKQHEIVRLSRLIHGICRCWRENSGGTRGGVAGGGGEGEEEKNNLEVIDFGAGKGHLSRALTFALGERVVCLEADEKFTCGAKQYDVQVETGLVKKKRKKSKNAALNKVMEEEKEVEEGETAQTVSVDEEPGEGKNAATKERDENFRIVSAFGKSKSNVSENRNLPESPLPPPSPPSSDQRSLLLVHPRHVTLKLHPQISARQFQSVVRRPPKVDGRSKSLVDVDGDRFDIRRTYDDEVSNATVNFGSSNVSAYNGADANAVDDRANDKNASMNGRGNVLDGGSDADDAFVMAGLHACGDLSTAMLRLFTEVPSAVGLVSVACCYMKLSERAGASSKTCSDGSNGVEERFSQQRRDGNQKERPSTTVLSKKSGYPMSDFSASLPGHFLSYEAKELSCHAIENYAEKLRQSSSSSHSLRLHCHRAALEFVLRQADPSLVKPQVRGGKKITSLPFWDYARESIAKLGLTSSASLAQVSEERRRRVDEELLPQWRRVAVHYALRLMAAPLIESCILLDRLIYLRENGIENSWICPVFDPKVSPRNFAIVAVKGDTLDHGA